MAPPEKAQEVQMRVGAQSIYDALKLNDSNPRHRQRKTTKPTHTKAFFQLIQPTDEMRDDGNKTEKAQEGKGWVYLPEDDPKAQAPQV
jgi:hypothetical protein